MSDICYPEARTLDDVLDGRKTFYVPSYQRRYDWKYNEQVDQLYHDLLGNYEEDSRQEYLLGPIVIVDGEQKEIVDGQQRLVTLTLWFCAMRDYLLDNEEKFINDSRDQQDREDLINNINESVHKDGKPLICLNNERDADAFAEICLRGKHTKTHNKVNTNYKSLSSDVSKHWNQTLKNKESSEALRLVRTMFDRIKKNTSFVYIKITDVNYAYQVFQSLNSKGQDLKQADLIKSEFLNKCKDDENAKEQIKYKWKCIEESIPSKNLDDFLYYSMLSRNDKYSDNLQKNRMHKNLKNLEIDAIKKYLEDRNTDIEFYNMLDSPSDVLPKKFSDFRPLFYGMQQINAKYFQRVIIAALRECPPPQAKILVECLLKFFFMYRTICKKDTDQIKRISREATHAICNGNSMSKILRTILQNDKSKPYVEQLEFEREFGNNASELPPKTIKYILFSIEHHCKYEVGGVPINTADFELEHVFPKNPKTGSWDNEDDLTEHRERLGNVTLLDSKWNKAIKNSSFEVKKTKGDHCYKKSKLELNKYFLTCSKWDVEEIDKRELHIVREYARIWSLSEFERKAKNPT